MPPYSKREMNPISPEQAIRRALELLVAGKAADAEHLFRKVLQSPPTDAKSLQTLGVIAQRLALHVDAAALLGRAIALSPITAEDNYHLSISLDAMGDRGGAEAALQKAIAIKPDLAEAHTNLGALLFRRGDTAGALGHFKTAVSLQPNNAPGFLNLGKILRGQDRLDEAEANFRRAIAIAPKLAPAWNMLGSCLRESGQIGPAIDAFSRATQLDPNYREAHSNLCYALYFDPNTTPTKIIATHREWANRFANNPVGADVSHSIDRSPDRRLRIGYVSPNLRSHVVGSFMLPIFQNHDRSRFEIVAYSDTTIPDEMSHRLRIATDLWRDTGGLTDEVLAEQVRSDRIDILIDLNLHMRGCRLGAFAKRPAPVQLTHLAYCGTSGLSQIDGCVCDVHMIGEGNEQYFTEQLLPLPRTYWSYPAPAAASDVGPLPADRNGYVTFGSMNTLAKVNEQVIGAWAELLNRVPNSRLVLFAPGAEVDSSILGRFESNGIERSRVVPVPREGLQAYFATYNTIDIALDPFPYNGGTTTLDALWMGVPVVTVAGGLPVGRAGVSMLTNLGLQNLIAKSRDEYVRIAVETAADLTGLRALRSQLRSRMMGSSLMDASLYVKDLEALYQQAWQKWAGERSEPGS